MKKELIYGHDKTIHRTGHLDIGVDENGVVTEVWFRCIQLPFEQFEARRRAGDEQPDLPKIKAITVVIND